MKEELVFNLRWDLQFFAKEGQGGEKTEEPTAKKIQDTRKEGQVAKSKEVSSAGLMIALFLSIRIFIGFVGNRLYELFPSFYGRMGEYVSDDNLRTHTVWQLLLEAIIYLVVTVAPFVLIALVFAFLFQKIQFKWMVTTKPLKPKFSNLNPINGFKRMFSKKQIFELLISIVKITIFAAIAYSVVKDYLGVIYTVYDLTIGDCLLIVFDMVMDLGIKISLVYLIIGVADYFYQRMKHKEDIKMTKQEVKDEYKNQEGDPHVKGQQKQRMQQAARRRMMQAIPEADVVITNPTHFAVAIKYDNTVNQAPVVLAKGADYLAFRIRDIAKENDVEVVENKPLARLLYSNVKLGDEIPPELYQMVADVLAYVYKLKQKAS